MYKAAIEIAAPPAKIFEFMADPKHLQSWQPDVALLVASMKRNEHIAYRTEAPTVSAYVEYQIVPWGPKTLVVSTGAVRPKGFLRSLYPLLQGLINKIMQRKMQSRLMLLRASLESHA
jgi:hypothetical protein